MKTNITLFAQIVNRTLSNKRKISKTIKEHDHDTGRIDKKTLIQCRSWHNIY